MWRRRFLSVASVTSLHPDLAHLGSHLNGLLFACAGSPPSLLPSHGVTKSSQTGSCRSLHCLFTLYTSHPIRRRRSISAHVASTTSSSPASSPYLPLAFPFQNPLAALLFAISCSFAHSLRGSWTPFLPLRHFSIILHAWFFGSTTAFIWETAESLFETFVSVPVGSHHHLTTDPNTTFVSGVSSSDITLIFFALLRGQSSCDGGHNNRQCAEDRNIPRPQEQPQYIAPNLP